MQVWSVFNRIVDRLILLNKQPYTFQSAHKMLQEPYDYFEFGQMYSRLLVDYNKSYLRNLEKWDEIAEKIKRGENIILTGNHQSESDAAFIPLLLEVYNRKLGEQVIYVAGDRVVSDPMVQPFSMGRNLFCVHSKKHMDDDPRMSREAKQKMNRKTLLEMSKAFKKGGNLVWTAPVPQIAGVPTILSTVFVCVPNVNSACRVCPNCRMHLHVSHAFCHHAPARTSPPCTTQCTAQTTQTKLVPTQPPCK